MHMHTVASGRPTKGSKTERVWELADTISRETGKPARREEVIKRYTDEGGNSATASTQYSQWKKASLGQASAKPLAIQDSSKAIVLSVGQDGRLLIPQELRLQMRLGDEGKVTARIEDGELRLISPSVALERLHKLIKSQDKNPRSIVSELLEQRRLEAKSE